MVQAGDGRGAGWRRPWCGQETAVALAGFTFHVVTSVQTI